uniref:Uncharacterized protein n=1 Tax=Ditylenchus dipsaci TaxID=166011 RepID=A0A915CLU6_9BILA
MPFEPSGHGRRLPWKKIEDKNKVMDMKQACLNEKKDLIAPKLLCREKFLLMISYITTLDYHNGVDYSYLYKMLKQAALQCKVDMDAPYEWEKKASKSDS